MSYVGVWQNSLRFCVLSFFVGLLSLSRISPCLFLLMFLLWCLDLVFLRNDKQNAVRVLAHGQRRVEPARASPPHAQRPRWFGSWWHCGKRYSRLDLTDVHRDRLAVRERRLLHDECHALFISIPLSEINEIKNSQASENENKKWDLK